MIEKVEMYSAICDNCKETLELCGGYAALNDRSSVQEELDDSDWSGLENDKVYCPDCHVKKWDDDEENLFAYTKDGQLLSKIQ